MAEQDKDIPITLAEERVSETRAIDPPGAARETVPPFSNPPFINQSAAANTPNSGWSTWFAAFALLLAIVAVGGGYFLWMELSRLRTVSTTQMSNVKADVQDNVKLQLDKTVADQKAAIIEGTAHIEATIADTHDAIAAVQGGFTELRQQLNERISALEQSLAGQQATIAQAQNELNRAIGLHRNDWAIAEVSYLLSLAADKLQFERRADTALVLLQSAQQRLQELPSPAFAAVRSAVDGDIAALSEITQPDLTHVATTLQQLALKIEQLPLSGASVALPQTAENGPKSLSIDPNAGFFYTAWAYASNAVEGVWQGIKRLVVIQQKGTPSEPLLPPEQAFFLQQNLRLKLEAAAVAALKGDNESYRHNLEAINLWLHRFFNIDAADTQEFVQQLVALEKIDVAPKLPTLSAPDAMQQALGTVRASNAAAAVVAIPAPKPKNNEPTDSTPPQAAQP